MVCVVSVVLFFIIMACAPSRDFTRPETANREEIRVTQKQTKGTHCCEDKLLSIYCFGANNNILTTMLWHHQDPGHISKPEFIVFCKKHPALLFPSFQMQLGVGPRNAPILGYQDTPPLCCTTSGPPSFCKKCP